MEGTDGCPGRYLRGRGVYRIYYQSEPVTSLVFTKDEVDEVWDFSWHNIDKVSSQKDAPLPAIRPDRIFKGSTSDKTIRRCPQTSILR